MARTALRALALVAAAAVFCAVLAAPDDAHAFEFELGSDGSYGPIDITTDTTLPLPPDGVFHATTINIAAGATLTFTPNAENTGVVLLATGDVTLAGTIDVSGFDSVGATGGDPGPGGSRGDSYVVGGGYG